jgi:hypothetical protein
MVSEWTVRGKGRSDALPLLEQYHGKISLPKTGSESDQPSRRKPPLSVAENHYSCVILGVSNHVITSEPQQEGEPPDPDQPTTLAAPPPTHHCLERHCHTVSQTCTV